MSKAGFRYHPGHEPHAPFANVSVGVPSEPDRAVQLPGQVDTGAYKSVIPMAVVRQFHLPEIRPLEVMGINGVVVVMNTYSVQLCIHGLSPIQIEVLGGEGEDHVLLGRDVLNRYIITLDGPNKSLVVQEP